MKYSQMLGKTTRMTQGRDFNQSYMKLVRGGFIRSLATGLFSYLPLGIRVLDNIKAVISDELDALGGQKVQVPFVNPREIWEKSGRAQMSGTEFTGFTDKEGKHFVLSPTHEEAMVELIRSSAVSYRELPLILYQFQTKFRDENKPRCGLIRTREFTMNDAYSFHRSYSDMNNFFPRVHQAYERIFSRCGLRNILSAEAGSGFMGGSRAYEFFYLSELGQDSVVICKHCGYKANKQIARGSKSVQGESLKPVERVFLEEAVNLNTLAEALSLSRNKLAKTMVFHSRKGPVMAVVRADYDVSLEKLSSVLGFPVNRIASKKEIDKLGLDAAYLSPVNLKSDIPVIVDELIENTPNLVFASNEPGYYYKNVNFGRDFEWGRVADIALIGSLDACMVCGHSFEEKRAIEIANIFKLDDYYSRAMNLIFRDENSRDFYPFMASYGIGLGRLLGTVVEENNDEHGIVWPWALAPYKVYLMGIGKSVRVKELVFQLESKMKSLILCDDRAESISVKFKDADLLGIPLRIVISTRGLQEGLAEFRERKSGIKWFVPIENIEEEIMAYGRKDSNSV